jgi:hypothetical protein
LYHLAAMPPGGRARRAAASLYIDISVGAGEGLSQPKRPPQDNAPVRRGQTALVGLLVAAVHLAATRHGIGFMPDSWGYGEGSVSLREGCGYPLSERSFNY